MTFDWLRHFSINRVKLHRPNYSTLLKNKKRINTQENSRWIYYKRCSQSDTTSSISSAGITNLGLTFKYSESVQVSISSSFFILKPGTVAKMKKCTVKVMSISSAPFLQTHSSKKKRKHILCALLAAFILPHHYCVNDRKKHHAAPSVEPSDRQITFDNNKEGTSVCDVVTSKYYTLKIISPLFLSQWENSKSLQPTQAAKARRH